MPDEEQPDLTIGEAARRAGLRTSALRFYEAKGLLPPPPRAGGARRYHPTVLRRLALIDVAKRAGFTLAEIRELLDGFDDAAPGSIRWRAMAARKLRQVEDTIQGARTMQRLLREGPFSVRRAGGRWGYPTPFAYRRGPGLMQANLLFDTLLWKDAAGRLVPWIAERWEANEDGTRFRFRLRHGVRWHDGAPLTADDVAFTFGYLSSGPGRASGVLHLQGVAAVGDVVAEDARTVVFRLPRPYAPFLEWVAGRMLVIPRHVWEGVADPETFRGPAATVGSGPFRLDLCDEARGSYRYTAHEGYFLRTPYVERLEFVAVGDELEALAEGRVDAASFLSDGGRPSRQRLASFGPPDYRRAEQPGEWTRALRVHMGRGQPYADRRFRQALAYAIDRRALVDRLLDASGEPASLGGLSPSHPLATGDLPTYPHDPVRARRLLDDVGLADRTGDGFRDLPDGRSFHPELQTDAADPGAAELVAAHLRDVGIRVGITRLPDAAADAASAQGRYEMALVGYGALGGDPDWIRIRLSPNAAEPTHAKVHGYESPRFERLADRQAACVNAARRAALVADLQRVVAEDLPEIPLYVPQRLEVTPAKHVFDAWYFTPGGVWGGYPGSLNKHALVTGQR